MSIRETWGDTRLYAPQHIVQLVFLVGVSVETLVPDALLMESDAYGDIIQEDFLDAYRNLTYKGIMGLKWVSTYCQQARFLLKTDDDIFVNMFSMLAHLQTRMDGAVIAGSRITNLLLCLVWTRMKVDHGYYCLRVNVGIVKYCL